MYRMSKAGKAQMILLCCAREVMPGFCLEQLYGSKHCSIATIQ